MNFIAGLIKRNKWTTTIIAGVILISVALFYWNDVKDNIYQEGYNDAVSVYQEKMIDIQNEHTDYVNQRLREQRIELNKQQEDELRKVKKEAAIDDNTEENIKYIKEEVFIKGECNVVPTDINRLSNEYINTINGTKQG